MRFIDLPSDIDVGGIHLTPLDGHAVLKQYTCLCCDRMSPSVIVCSHQHVLCKECCIFESRLSREVWCPVCKHAVIGSESKFRIEILDKFHFECACGFRGTLEATRRHLLQGLPPPEGHRMCGSEVSKTQSLETVTEETEDLDSRVKRLAIEELNKMKQRILEEIMQTLNNNHIYEKLLKQKNESVEQMDTQIGDFVSIIDLEQKFSVLNEAFVKNHSDHTEQLTEQKNQIVEAIEALKAEMSSIQKTTDSKMKQIEQKVLEMSKRFEDCEKDIATCTSYLWFNFEELLVSFEQNHERIESSDQSTVTGGVCLDVHIQLERVDNEDYLAVYLRRSDESIEDTPVPLNRKFRIKIHDMNGLEVDSEELNSLQDGKYIANCGTSSDDESEYSGFYMMTIESVKEKKCLVGGVICVSIGVSPMD